MLNTKSNLALAEGFYAGSAYTAPSISLTTPRYPSFPPNRPTSSTTLRSPPSMARALPSKRAYTSRFRTPSARERRPVEGGVADEVEGLDLLADLVAERVRRSDAPPVGQEYNPKEVHGRRPIAETPA